MYGHLFYCLQKCNIKLYFWASEKKEVQILKYIQFIKPLLDFKLHQLVCTCLTHRCSYSTLERCNKTGFVTIFYVFAFSSQ